MSKLNYSARSLMFAAVQILFAVLAVAGAVASNAISIENSLTGNPASDWDISGVGDSSIQGFATEMSVNRGEVVRFKVSTDARAYRIDIYRLGYYKGLGARKMTSVTPSVALPQNQPSPLTSSSTGLVDCGNWKESASWTVPATAVSGVYIAKLVRTDTGGASHIVFVVRDDSSRSDFLFQTSDTTWQAYNTYGGNSLYVGSPAGRAYKVSYNRPFVTRQGDTTSDWLFNAEYPMIRWMEANGYDVSYTTGIDTDRRGTLLLNHKSFLSVGHDEYWSGGQRTNVEAARAAGVSLAFFSGNEVFWKTRWEPSIDGSGTPYRTLVCYKETHAGAKIDPSPIWTGTWRDPRFSPPSDGGRPENALLGTLFTVNGPRNDAISVPASFGAHRFWRNTNVATLPGGQTATFPLGTLGYEWDEAPRDASQPPGLMRLSSTTVSGVPLLQDYGSKYATGQATHNLTLYRHSSGALVFGAGTVQWSWGLDAVHDNSSGPADSRMQQATVNLFADMGCIPATLQPGLVPAVQSNDVTPPVSTISAPSTGTKVQTGQFVTITGTSVDSSGRVWGVEVSVDGGSTWQTANGLGNWTFAWTASRAGSVTLKARALDDSGNMEVPGAGVTVTVEGPSQVGLWPSTAAPVRVDDGADSPVELGVKFRSDVAGVITGIRFYKASTNTGTHVGSLWSSTGTRLAFATFGPETASGWQQVNFSTPVNIAANTVYIASYHCPAGHYSADVNYFATNGVDAPPLHALANGVSGANGVYRYGPAGSFPSSTFQSTNYWVDVVYKATPTSPLTSIAVTPSNPSVLTGNNQQFTATGTYADGTTQNLTNQVTWGAANTAIATISSSGLASAVKAGTATITASSGSVSGSTTLTVQTAPLQITTTSLPSGNVNGTYSATLEASGGTTPRSWSLISGALPGGLTLGTSTGVISGTPTIAGTFSFTVRVTDSSTAVQSASKAFNVTISTAPATVSIWPSTAVPVRVDDGADSPVELGVKFRSDVAGVITGIRFYKASTNTGTHVGSLWSSTGTRLAFATFGPETASGWQQVNFSTPVNIAANTVYIASYHCPAGHYSADVNYFATNGVDAPPLHALANGVSGPNSVFRYGPAGSFPNSTWQAANYWVDVVFQPSSAVAAVAGSTDVNSTVSTSSVQKSGATDTVLVNSITDAQPVSLLLAAASSNVAIGNAALLSSVSASTKESNKTASLISASPAKGLELKASSGKGAFAAASGGAIGSNEQTRTTTVSLLAAPANLDTAAALAASDSSIWPSTAVPVKVDDGADSPVELGVKFRSDVAGTITGIRFYKATTNTGTHVGSLWSSTGTRLAFATFGPETASGWQQVNFSTPVSITANTVYVASYHCPAGHYSADVNYFATNGVDAPPLHALANGISGPNSVYRYGPAGTFPNATFQSTNYWVDVVFQATSTSPLTSIAVTPSNPSVLTGNNQQFTATGTYADSSTQNLTNQVTWGAANTAVATISSSGLASAVKAGTATITASSGSVSGSTTLTVQTAPLQITTTSLPGGFRNGAYSATLEASGGSTPRSWSLASGTLPIGLTLGTSTGVISGTPTAAGTFNFTVRATDASAPVQSASKALNITISTVPPSYNLWTTAAVPSVADIGRDSAVELGVKFRSDIPGIITGIRFYKASANTGTHVGSLWSSTGTRLAFATFGPETASGWQQVNFSTPINISANTVYVASYHCPAGHYSADVNYFATIGVDAPPLHALANGISGPNGVYRYGPAGSFPNSTFQSTNYWVDVVFQEGSVADTTAPTVTSTQPQGGTTGFVPGSPITVTFSENVDTATVNTSTLILRTANNATVSASVTYDSSSRTALITPNAPLEVASTYTATVKGGSSGVADSAGNRLASDVTWSFSTSTYGAQGGGPGGPILIITNGSNPFSRYYAEILLAEGLNNFAIRDVSEVTSTVLSTADVVIMGAIPLTDSQVTMFTSWVNAGGNLIAMRPDKKLAPLLGLTDTGGTLSEGYLLVNTASEPGAGIVGQTIQYHGVADRYNLASATRVATLYSGAQTATSNPAVSLRNVGSNGGQAAAFTYDLARSIVLTRQGNPAWAGLERDGRSPLRSDDLFFGPAVSDPQPDWIDFDKVAIPQADEQQRLLANLIILMNADRKLMPRFWYFPHGHEAVVVDTGDDHAVNGTQGRFDQQVALSPVNGSVDDWETVRSTSYIFVNSGALTDSQAVAYTAAGFELSLHISTGCANYTKDSLDALFAQQLAQWKTAYPSLASPVTNRNHCIAWSGYTILPEVESKYGIRLDTTYYYWPDDWVLNRPGFMTGSAMPMRFSTAEGNVIDVYQAATQMTDESKQAYPFTVNQLVDKARGPEGYYGAFVANMHTDHADLADEDALVLAAIDKEVPIISARQLLIWTDARNSSAITSLQSSSSAVAFSIKTNSAARGLKVMVPLPQGASVSGITYNGSPVPYFVRVIKGIAYAFVDAFTGNYVVSFGTDNTAPTITQSVPPAGSTGVPHNSTVSITFSEPIDSSTLTANNFILRNSANTVIPASISYASTTSTATLTPASLLSAGTVYTVVVRGGANGVLDMARNPLARDFVASFTTVPLDTTPTSIWSNTATPAIVSVNDPKAVELGLKFTSQQKGQIRGIRFYKGSSNTGVHVGNLWTQTGSPLASVTFTNETTSGWQYQEFPTPIPITANTVYVVSYRTSVGFYSASTGYFTNGAFTNGPLRALSNAESGGNGVYKYGAAGGFPNLSASATNYWVDVVFEATP